MTDLVDLLRRAINDPGQFCPRDRRPDTSGIGDWEYEPIGAWGARAAAIALADAGCLAAAGQTREQFRVVYDHRLGHPVMWSENWPTWDGAESSRLAAVAVGYTDATIQKRTVGEWMPVEVPDGQ